MFLLNSYQSFFEKFKTVISRYWLAGIMDLATAILFFLLINNSSNTFILKYIFIAIFMTFLALTFAIVLNQKKTQLIHHLLNVLLTIASGLILFFVLPDPTNHNINTYTYFTIGGFVIALFLFLPFYKNKNNENFLNNTKTLLLNAGTSSLFAIMVIIGLNIFISILKYLFAIYINRDIYEYVITITYTLVAFWIFVFLLPTNFAKTKFNEMINKLLEIVSKYILIPFSIIYTVTLYIYSLKILFTNVWPSNQAVSIVGISFVILFLIYLLLWSETKQKFIKYWRIYATISLPLLIVYFLAIIFRINQYGFTEERTLALFFGGFAFLLALYLIINQKISFKFIPLILGIALLLLNFGPWSIFNITKNSQLNHYQDYLIENQFIINNQINPNKKITRFDEEYFGIQTKTGYLTRKYGNDIIKPFFPNEDFSGLENHEIINHILNLYTK